MPIGRNMHQYKVRSLTYVDLTHHYESHVFGGILAVSHESPCECVAVSCRYRIKLTRTFFPGTADSTIPSPIPQARRKLPPVSTDAEKDFTSPAPLPVPVRVPAEDTYAEPLPIPATLVSRPRSSSRWDPASPTALAKLLASITPRESASPSPAPDASFDIEEEFSSPTVGGSNDSDLSSSPGLGLSGVGAAVAAAIIAESESLAQAQGVPRSLLLDGVECANANESGGPITEDGDDDGAADLHAALEGVWKMWKRSRRGAAGSQLSDDGVAREVFLRTARLVVDNA